MTTEFDNYVATQDARNTIQLNVREYALILCDALEQDFVQDCLCRANFNKATDPVQQGKDRYKFYIESGRKYYKLIMETDSGDRSVHCFINMKTGELHKSASWKTPVKEPRFDLRVIKEREFVFKNADWAGGYLYKNFYYTGD